MGLKVFFEELKKRPTLKDSLVIITGDHAFPLGEHGNYNLEAGYHEESFHIPFFMVWDGVLTPQKITNPASQIDIGPTIMDLLTIDDQNTSFQGKSITKSNRIKQGDSINIRLAKGQLDCTVDKVTPSKGK